MPLPLRAKPAAKKKKSIFRAINRDRPLEPFQSANCKRPGIANACAPRNLTTTPPNWFGEIPASHCPEPPRNGERGVEVGDSWANKFAAKQDGVVNQQVSGTVEWLLFS